MWTLSSWKDSIIENCSCLITALRPPRVRFTNFIIFKIDLQVQNAIALMMVLATISHFRPMFSFPNLREKSFESYKKLMSSHFIKSQFRVHYTVIRYSRDSFL